MMLRIALAAIMVASITGVVALTGILPTSAQTDPSATRSINPATVAPGGTVTVTIQAAGYGQAGGVTETLPAGFAYVSSGLSATARSTKAARMSGSPSRGTTPSPTPLRPPALRVPMTSPAISGTSSVTTTAWAAIPASRWRLPVHQVHQLPAPTGASTRRRWPPAER